MNIIIYNLVNKSNKVKPSYNLDKSVTSISIYFNRNKDLLIIGEIDSN